MRVFQHERCGGVAYTVDDKGFFVLGRGYQGLLSEHRVQFPYGGVISCETCRERLWPDYRPSLCYHIGVAEIAQPLRAQAFLARHARKPAAECPA